MAELSRPIAFFDLETTGVDTSKDRIVEISIVIAKNDLPCGVYDTWTQKINPEIDIPESATEVHGISNIDVIDCPKFSDIAAKVLGMFNGCDISGYNIKGFDLPLIIAEFGRAGISDFPDPKARVLDVFEIFKDKHPRNLAACYKIYTGQELKDAHSAEADTIATADILAMMMEEVHDDISTVEAIDAKYNTGMFGFSGKFSIDDDGQVCFAFGKHKGQRCIENIFYLQWMKKANFGAYVNEQIKQILSNNGQVR